MLKKGLEVENWSHRTQDETPVESDVSAPDSCNNIFPNWQKLTGTSSKTLHYPYNHALKQLLSFLACFLQKTKNVQKYV